MFLSPQHKKDPDPELRQSLEILSSLAQSNRQIATTISQIVSNHLATKNASHLHPENTRPTQQANSACKIYHQPPPSAYDTFAHNNDKSSVNLHPPLSQLPAGHHAESPQREDEAKRRPSESPADQADDARRAESPTLTADDEKSPMVPPTAPSHSLAQSPTDNLKTGLTQPSSPQTPPSHQLTHCLPVYCPAGQIFPPCNPKNYNTSACQPSVPLTVDNEPANSDTSEDEIPALLDDSSEDEELPKKPMPSPPSLAPEEQKLPNVSRTDHRTPQKSLSSLSASEIIHSPFPNTSSAPENYADHSSLTSHSHRKAPEEHDVLKDDNPFLTLASKPAGNNKNASRKTRRKTARRSLQMQDLADDVLLEEASERNTIMKEYKTPCHSFAQSNPVFTYKQNLMSLAESSARNELECEESLQTQTLVFAQFHESEHLQREFTLTAVKGFYVRVYAQTYLCHHKEVLHKSLTAYTNLILMQFEEFEEVCRKQIRSDHTTTSNKAFGPDPLSPNRGFTIKSHQSHSAPFSAAWRKMALLNTNGQPMYDPFQHTESTQANFLRTQGLLPGPCITHYPLNVSAGNRSWYDIVEKDPPEADFSCHPPEETVPHKFEFTLPSIHLQTPWTQDTTLAESLGAWTTTWGENVKRSVCELQQMAELADLLADSHHKHLFQHLSKMVDLFMEFDILKWHAIVSF